MPATIQEVLGYTALIEAIEIILKGIPDELPTEFHTVTENAIGNTARYVQMTGTRQTSKLSAYGAAAHKRALVDIGKRDLMLLHTFEEINFDPIVLQNLMQYQSYELQQMGKQEVARQLENFVELFLNLRRAVLQQTLLNAVVYFDAEGNLLPSSSGAVLTVDFGRSANNANQLNGIIDVSWDNNNANIPKQLISLEQQAAKDHGYPLGMALYGKNVRGYISQNNFCVDYLARDPLMNHQFNTSLGIPKGFLNFEWYPIYRSFFADQNNVNQTIWDDDTIVFCPRQVTKKWYSMIQGSYPVPTNVNIIGDVDQALSSVVIKYGMAGFSRLLINPNTIATYMLDTFMPTLKNPNVTYAAKVKF